MQTIQDLLSIISISWREIWLYLNKKYHFYMMRKQWILFLSVLQNHSMLKVMIYHNLYWAKLNLGLLWWLSGKESACSVRDPGLIHGLRRFRWRRAWQLTPIFLSGEFHGQKSLAGYSPWGWHRVGHDWSD